MFLRKYRHILIAFGLASLVSFFLVYLTTIDFFQGAAKKPESTGSQQIMEHQESLDRDHNQKQVPWGHLGLANGKVAVFQGPAGGNGPLIRELPISWDSLPPQWQEDIQQGLIEFKNEKELKEALDSLDEYR